MIRAHNHPSGDPEPSARDADLTARLVAAGEVLGIPLLDHVILGVGARYVSMAARGLVRPPRYATRFLREIRRGAIAP